MLYATAFVMHQIIIHNQLSQEIFRRSMMLAVAVLSFSVIHCILNDLNLHSLVFASMIIYIAIRTSEMIKNTKNRDWRDNARKRARIGSGKVGSRFLAHHGLMLRGAHRSSLLRDWVPAMARRHVPLSSITKLAEANGPSLGFPPRTTWLVRSFVRLWQHTIQS